MALVIEFAGRSGQSNPMLRVDTTVVSIGRSFDNAVILKDPHVDPVHVILRIDPITQTIRCIDNSSHNGVWVVDENGKKKRVIGSVILTSGQGLLLGRTKIRVYSDSHVVEPARPLSAWESYLAIIGNWWLIAVFAISLFGLVVLDDYLSAPFSDKLFKHLLSGLGTLVLSIVYAGIWASVGKLSRHDMRFSVQLGLVLLTQLVWHVYSFFEPALLFNLEISHIGEWLQKVLLIVLSFVSVYIAATLGTHLAQKSRLAVAAIMPVGIIIMTIGDIIENPDFSIGANYDKSLVAPGWQWRQRISPEEFLEKARENYGEQGAETYLFIEAP